MKILDDLVASLSYLDWVFTIDNKILTISVYSEDSRKPGCSIRINHCFMIPPASYNARSWRRWLFARVIDVQTHEAGEHFMIGAQRPFAPLHGPGNDPYFVYDPATEEEKATNQDGSI